MTLQCAHLCTVPLCSVFHLQPLMWIIQVWLRQRNSLSLLPAPVSLCFISRVIKQGGGEHLNRSGDEHTGPWRRTQLGESLCCVHRGDASVPSESTHWGKFSNGCHHSSLFYVCSYNAAEGGGGCCMYVRIALQQVLRPLLGTFSGSTCYIISPCTSLGWLGRERRLWRWLSLLEDVSAEEPSSSNTAAYNKKRVQAARCACIHNTLMSGACAHSNATGWKDRGANRDMWLLNTSLLCKQSNSWNNDSSLRSVSTFVQEHYTA